jgi:hypothetical protein
MLADAMVELSGKVRLTSATTPTEYAGRIATYDVEVRDIPGACEAGQGGEYPGPMW